MVVSGFPDAEQRHRGIFNLRAAQALGRLVDITVIRVRAWKVGRRRVEVGDFEGVRVISVSVPLVRNGLTWSIALSSLVEDLVLGPQVEQRGWFRREALQRVVDEHRRSVNRANLLWTLLVLELWVRMTMHGRS
jgi:hypothetical protein